jgi:hypothetical protein
MKAWGGAALYLRTLTIFILFFRNIITSQTLIPEKSCGRVLSSSGAKVCIRRLGTVFDSQCYFPIPTPALKQSQIPRFLLSRTPRLEIGMCDKTPPQVLKLPGEFD